MSLARWNCDDSDVYVYSDVAGGYTVHVATDSALDRQSLEPNECADYLIELRDKHGCSVPEYAIDRARDGYQLAGIEGEQ